MSRRTPRRVVALALLLGGVLFLPDLAAAQHARVGATAPTAPMSAAAAVQLQRFLATPIGAMVLEATPSLIGARMFDVTSPSQLQALGSLSESVPAGLIGRIEAEGDAEARQVLLGEFAQAYHRAEERVETRFAAEISALLEDVAAGKADPKALAEKERQLIPYAIYRRFSRGSFTTLGSAVHRIEMGEKAAEVAASLRLSPTAPADDGSRVVPLAGGGVMELAKVREIMPKLRALVQERSAVASALLEKVESEAQGLMVSIHFLPEHRALLAQLGLADDRGEVPPDVRKLVRASMSKGAAGNLLFSAPTKDPKDYDLYGGPAPVSVLPMPRTLAELKNGSVHPREKIEAIDKALFQMLGTDPKAVSTLFAVYENEGNMVSIKVPDEALARFVGLGLMKKNGVLTPIARDFMASAMKRGSNGIDMSSSFAEEKTKVGVPTP